jgi:hypothetical protein
MQDFTGGPGFMAFVFTFAVVVLTMVLFRSLGKHLRKVRTNPPQRVGDGQDGPNPAMSGTEDRDRGGDVVTQEPDDR